MGTVSDTGGTVLTPEQAAAADVNDPNEADSITAMKQRLQEPLVNLPRISDPKTAGTIKDYAEKAFPKIAILDTLTGANVPVDIYNATAPAVSGLTSPVMLATMPVAASIHAEALAGNLTAKLAQAGMSAYFAHDAAVSGGADAAHALEVSQDPKATMDEKIEAWSKVAPSAAIAAMSGAGLATSFKTVSPEARAKVRGDTPEPTPEPPVLEQGAKGDVNPQDAAREELNQQIGQQGQGVPLPKFTPPPKGPSIVTQIESVQGKGATPTEINAAANEAIVQGTPAASAPAPVPEAVSQAPIVNEYAARQNEVPSSPPSFETGNEAPVEKPFVANTETGRIVQGKPMTADQIAKLSPEEFVAFVDEAQKAGGSLTQEAQAHGLDAHGDKAQVAELERLHKEARESAEAAVEAFKKAKKGQVDTARDNALRESARAQFFSEALAAAKSGDIHSFVDEAGNLVKPKPDAILGRPNPASSPEISPDTRPVAGVDNPGSPDTGDNVRPAIPEVAPVATDAGTASAGPVESGPAVGVSAAPVGPVTELPQVRSGLRGTSGRSGSPANDVVGEPNQGAGNSGRGNKRAGIHTRDGNDGPGLVIFHDPKEPTIQIHVSKAAKNGYQAIVWLKLPNGRFHALGHSLFDSKEAAIAAMEEHGIPQAHPSTSEKASANPAEFVKSIYDDFPRNPLNPREIIVGDSIVQVSRGPNGRVTIDLIRALERGQGAGSAALLELIRRADEAGVGLELFPKKVGTNGLSTPQLREWYARHGFDKTKSGDMVRKPQIPESNVPEVPKTVPVRDAAQAPQNAIQDTGATGQVSQAGREVGLPEPTSALPQPVEQAAEPVVRPPSLEVGNQGVNTPYEVPKEVLPPHLDPEVTILRPDEPVDPKLATPEPVEVPPANPALYPEPPEPKAPVVRTATIAEMEGATKILADRKKALIKKVANTVKSAIENPNIDPVNKRLIASTVRDVAGDMKNFKELPHNVIQYVHDEVVRLAKEGKKIVQDAKEAREIDLALEKNEMAKDAAKANPINLEPQRGNPGERISPLERIMQSLGKAKDAVIDSMRTINMALLSRDVALNTLDGFQVDRGFLSRRLGAAVDANYNRRLVMEDTARKPLLQLRKQLNLDDTSMERISLYAQARQGQGLRAVESGAKLKTVFPDDTVGPKLPGEGIIKLTPAEQKFYDASRKILDDLGRQIEEVVRNELNIDFKFEKDYWPLQRDWSRYEKEPPQPVLGASVGDEETQASLESFKDILGQFVPKNGGPSKGMTIARKPGAHTPIKLNAAENMDQAIHNAAQLITHLRDSVKWNKIINSPEFKAQYGTVGRDYAAGLIDTASRGGAPIGTKGWRWMDWLVKNNSVAVMGFRFSQLKHATNLGMALKEIPFDDLAIGLSESTIPNSAGWKFLRRNRPAIANRFGGEEAIRDIVQWGNPHDAGGMIRKIQQGSVAPERGLDSAIAGASWLGAYRAELKKMGIDPSNMLHQPMNETAAHIADVKARKVVYSPNVQDAPQAISRNLLTADNASLRKAVFNFQGTMLNQYSNIQQGFLGEGIKKGNWLGVAATAAVLTGYIAGDLAVNKGSKAIKNAMFGKGKPQKDDLVHEAVTELLRRAPIIGPFIGAYREKDTTLPIADQVIRLRDIGKQLISGTDQYGHPASRLKNKSMGIELGTLAASLMGVPGATTIGEGLQRELPRPINQTPR